jgi:hypothetical protein
MLMRGVIYCVVVLEERGAEYKLSFRIMFVVGYVDFML